MLKPIASIVALLALAVFGVPLAQAKTRHKSSAHKVTALVQEAEISQTGSVPAAGSTVTNAGTNKSNVGGNGANVDHLTVTGPVAGGKIGFTGKGTAFFAHGSVSGKIQGTATPQPDGTINYAGTTTITAGTDRYKGAKGKITFTGTSPGLGKVTTIHQTGTITY
ncbi:MAG: hypothetical protein E6G56_03680 [Actinobacteria bacterium]|nr:MAG: hypothetical protein E6G56_03680 [Actinomycetota bacterium]